jgi:O-methyltransferase involved in polyketide biosynthesis/fatty acid desaturase
MPPIQRTLAIPLVARARASKLCPDMGFADPEATRLLEALHFQGTDELAGQTKTVRGSIVRTQVFDDLTRRFLAAHPGATVVNLGAGLCTRQARAGAGAGRWIEADVADVIAAKNRLAPPDEKTLRLPCDLSDAAAVERVFDQILPEKPVLVIAEGVLMFVDKPAVARVFQTLERRLPAGSQIAFDYIHATIRRLARLHPAMRTTGAAYKSDFRPGRELALYPRLRPLGLRLFTDRYPLWMRGLDRAVGLALAGGSALYDVALLSVDARPHKPTHAGVAISTVLGAFACAAGSVLAGNVALYVALQILLALFMLRAFSVVHETSHGNVLAGRRANDLWGVLHSVLAALPYYSWKRVHIEHHKWAGWKVNDPTEGEEWDELKPAEQAIAGFAWRFSLPIIGASFSIRTFWNLPRLFRLFPQARGEMAFGVLFIPAFHVGVALLVGGGVWAAAFLPAFVLFLFLLDPLMISQHVGIPLFDAPGRTPRPLPHKEQEHLARTLVFPIWFARHVLLGFNYHSLHHERPGIAGHLLDDVPHTPTHVEGWWAWLTRAKRTPLGALLQRHP